MDEQKEVSTNPNHYEEQKRLRHTDERLCAALKAIGKNVTLEQVRTEFDAEAVAATIEARQGNQMQKLWRFLRRRKNAQ